MSHWVTSRDTLVNNVTKVNRKKTFSEVCSLTGPLNKSFTSLLSKGGHVDSKWLVLLNKLVKDLLSGPGRLHTSENVFFLMTFVVFPPYLTRVQTSRKLVLVTCV